MEILAVTLLELDTQIELAMAVGYISQQQHITIKEKIDEVGRILNG